MLRRWLVFRPDRPLNDGSVVSGESITVEATDIQWKDNGAIFFLVRRELPGFDKVVAGFAPGEWSRLILLAEKE